MHHRQTFTSACPCAARHAEASGPDRDACLRLQVVGICLVDAAMTVTDMDGLREMLIQMLENLQSGNSALGRPITRVAISTQLKDVPR